jgi:hypothetical protein
MDLVLGVAGLTCVLALAACCLDLVCMPKKKKEIKEEATAD